MKITIERNALLKSLNHVQSVVERRNTIPILSNVRLVAGDGALELTATDLDIQIVETTAVQVDQPGATTLPAHLLYDIVRKLADGAQAELTKDEGEGQFTLHSGRSHFELQSRPAADFPDLAAGEMTHGFSLDANDLKKLIEKTRFAISTEETRYYLNGIYLHEAETGNGPVLRGVATDGHRLARVDLPLPPGASGMPGIIIPRKTVLELHKLLEDPDGQVEISLSDAKIRFIINGTVLTSKLIDGTFPDYERVIPSDNKRELELDGAIFTRAVDRVSTVSSEKGRAVKLSLSSDKLILTVTNPDSGTATEEIAVSYHDEPLDIGFNARYLADITGQIESGNASFRLADSGAPALVFDRDDDSAIYVLMPMRV